MGTKQECDRTLPEDIVLSVRGVSKKFSRHLRRSMLYGMQDLGSNLVGIRMQRNALRKSEFWALQDISFDLKRGECLGLIGRNGCGKTTLLRILAGIFPPDQGEVGVRGRIGALIALGAGFHPNMTGMENIHLNGALLGMSRAEIRDRIDSIVEFAEIPDSINAPVSTYSSGMRVRLGFSIAIHIDPDLLLVDEVLAVGDMGFRAKCYNAMSELASKAAVIFVSHNMTHIHRIADRCLLLDDSCVCFEGNTQDAVMQYQGMFVEENETATRAGSGEVLAREICVNGKQVNEGDTVHANSGDAFTADLEVASSIDVEELTVNLYFTNVGGEPVAECGNYVHEAPISIHQGETKHISLRIPELTLNPAIYKLGLLLMSGDMVFHYDWLKDFIQLQVKGRRTATASQQFKATWSVKG